MSTLVKGLQLLLPLLMLMMHCIRAEEEQESAHPLLRLNDIVTERIHHMLRQHEHLRNQTENEKFLQHYERLAMAVHLPVDNLDEKIRAYNAYLSYGEEHLQLQATVPDSSSGDLLRVGVANGKQDYSAFENRVIKLLEKLGVYDRFTARVFEAIFSDEKQLRKLKKKLMELDDDNKKDECCFWDFIFGLF